MITRRHAPATARNRGPLLEVLRGVLPGGGDLDHTPVVLEIASGSGEHVVHFAAALPALQWQPSDVDEDCLASIAAWIGETGCGIDGGGNVRPPIRLDAGAETWALPGDLGPDARVDVIFNANMIHIAPWAACIGLLRGAGRHLAPAGLLVLYGPFRIGGQHTAASNDALDRDLRGRNAAWGVRDLEAVTALAAEHGLELLSRVEMPANNQTLIFRRA